MNEQIKQSWNLEISQGQNRYQDPSSQQPAQKQYNFYSQVIQIENVLKCVELDVQRVVLDD